MNSAKGGELIRTAGLSKLYPDTGTAALSDVSLSFVCGEFAAIKGPSGSGKSTLFNIIGGLITPSAGKVFFGETEVSGLKDTSVFRRENVGFAFRDFYLYPGFTALENVILPLAFGVSVSKEKKEKALSLLGLGGVAAGRGMT